MKTIVAVLFALLFNNCWAGWDSWSDDDKKLFVASNIAIAGDWMTTADIARNPTKYKEVGLVAKTLIGEHPSTNSVNLYFLVRTVLNYYITDNLTGDQKTYYLFFTTSSHGIAAIHNYQIGLRIGF